MDEDYVRYLDLARRYRSLAQQATADQSIKTLLYLAECLTRRMRSKAHIHLRNNSNHQLMFAKSGN